MTAPATDSEDSLQFRWLDKHTDPKEVWIDKPTDAEGSVFQSKDGPAIGKFVRRKTWTTIDSFDISTLNASFLVYLDDGQTGLGGRSCEAPGWISLSAIEVV